MAQSRQAKRNNLHVLFPRARIERPVYAPVITDSPNPYRREQVGAQDIYYEVTIDLQALTGMGQRAASNKSGKAKLGPVYVRVIERGDVRVWLRGPGPLPKGDGQS